MLSLGNNIFHLRFSVVNGVMTGKACLTSQDLNRLLYDDVPVTIGRHGSIAFSEPAIAGGHVQSGQLISSDELQLTADFGGQSSLSHHGNYCADVRH